MPDPPERTWIFDGVRPPTFDDAAWHEAGHAVARLVLGFEVEEMWVTYAPQPDGNPHRGETTCKANQFFYILRNLNRPEYDRRLVLVTLAGDLVDERRRVAHGAHKAEILCRLGGRQPKDAADGQVLAELFSNAQLLSIFEQQCTQARRLIDLHWLAVERLAGHLLASPGHRLRDLRARDLADLARP